MINKVEICGVNTAQLPTLTREEKDKLFVRIKAGDTAAREEFAASSTNHCIGRSKGTQSGITRASLENISLCGTFRGVYSWFFLKKPAFISSCERVFTPIRVRTLSLNWYFC